MPTELESTFVALIGKRVSIRLHDPEGGFRDIVGHLESPTSLRNRHGELIEFSHNEIFIWREVIVKK
jgi:N-acetylglutamate synthase